MLRATRVDSTELTHRVRFPALHMTSPLEVATVSAYLDTPEGRQFVEDCRDGVYRPERKPTRRRRTKR